VFVSDVAMGRHSLFAKVALETEAGVTFWLSVVYGPQLDHDKVEFMDELLGFRNAVSGPWCLCGDFNMLLRADDKNNSRMDRRGMARFRAFVNRAQLEEINLMGRRFTWSSGTERPTLERLDRVFVMADWLASFPNRLLKPLSSDCSDHCPLLLELDVLCGAKRRFRFEAFWTKMHGFSETVAAAWASTPTQADPCRVLDHKFRNVAKELRRWSNAQVGCVRLQLVRSPVRRYSSMTPRGRAVSSSRGRPTSAVR